jgi:hypothetical protein
MLEVLFAADAAATGDDHAGALQVDLALLAVSLDQLDREVRLVNSIFSSTISPVRDESGSSIGITPSRTVAICGHQS